MKSLKAAAEYALLHHTRWLCSAPRLHCEYPLPCITHSNLLCRIRSFLYSSSSHHKHALHSLFCFPPLLSSPLLSTTSTVRSSLSPASGQKSCMSGRLRGAARSFDVASRRVEGCRLSNWALVCHRRFALASSGGGVWVNSLCVGVILGGSRSQCGRSAYSLYSASVFPFFRF